YLTGQKLGSRRGTGNGDAADRHTAPNFEPGEQGTRDDRRPADQSQHGGEPASPHTIGHANIFAFSGTRSKGRWRGARALPPEPPTNPVELLVLRPEEGRHVSKLTRDRDLVRGRGVRERLGGQVVDVLAIPVVPHRRTRVGSTRG